jgi:hypothetical protein
MKNRMVYIFNIKKLVYRIAIISFLTIMIIGCANDIKVSQNSIETQEYEYADIKRSDDIIRVEFNNVNEGISHFCQVTYDSTKVRYEDVSSVIAIIKTTVHENRMIYDLYSFKLWFYVDYKILPNTAFPIEMSVSFWDANNTGNRITKHIHIIEKSSTNIFIILFYVFIIFWILYFINSYLRKRRKRKTLEKLKNKKANDPSKPLDREKDSYDSQYLELKKENESLRIQKEKKIKNSN